MTRDHKVVLDRRETVDFPDQLGSQAERVTVEAQGVLAAMAFPETKDDQEGPVNLGLTVSLVFLDNLSQETTAPLVSLVRRGILVLLEETGIRAYPDRMDFQAGMVIRVHQVSQVLSERRATTVDLDSRADQAFPVLLAQKEIQDRQDGMEKQGSLDHQGVTAHQVSRATQELLVCLVNQVCPE